MDVAEEQSKLASWDAILDDLGCMVDRIWSECVGREGYTHDPMIVSIQLFRRLKGHRNAFVTLANSDLLLDSEIIVRAALEAAICLVNLEKRRSSFIDDLRSDAATTIKGQLPIWFGSDPEDEAEAKDGLAMLFGKRRKDGASHEQFRMKQMAKDASIPDLYSWYKYLSGTSVHVTGISLFLDILPEQAQEMRRMRKVHTRGMICGATFYGCRAEAKMLGIPGVDGELEAIAHRMADAG